MKKHYFSLMIFLFFLIFFCNLPENIYSDENTFIQETLLLDIETSNYYDLVIWTNKLGIDGAGNIEELRAKLFTHYNISPDIHDNQIENRRSIIIESAKELNYINDVSIDQNYVILQGDVILEMIDPENNTSHKINADKIVFNQSEKTISAFGNIQYEIIRKGKSDYFHGESLVFEIETWEGIFFEGVSENNKIVEDENVSFFFSGENIYRSSDDRVILNKGSITSSKNEDPYYRIDADKIWVLGPGEWAIKNATLFVGRIPMLYIPFFFLPGDELIFNPAVGYKEVEGYFINTTTYIIGLKEDTGTDTFSFLKSNDDNTVAKEKIRNGLFLTSTERDLDTESWANSTGSSIKLLADYYSRKGFFFGLDGNLNFDSILNSLNIFAAFSISRYLFLDNENGVYTPFRSDVSGNYVSDYEESYLFGLRLPFRFAFDIDLVISNNWLKMNFDLPLYSDEKFRSHFMNREEGLKWTEFLSNNNSEDQVEEPEMSSLSWEIDGSLTPSFESLSPVIEKLSLEKMNIQLNWQSAVMNHLSEQEIDDLSLNGYTLEDSLSFYYPSSLVLPDVSGSMSGTLFKSLDGNTTEIDEKLLKKEFEYLKDPWIEEIIDPAKIDTDLLLDPEAFEYLPLEFISENNKFSNILKYSITPSFSVNSIFSSEVPASVEDINYRADYSIFSTQTTSLLDYSFNIQESLLSFSNVSIFSMNYKQHFNPNEVEGVWDSYLLQDKNATNYKLTDNIDISSKPFINSRNLSESIFTYSLNSTLYNRYFDSASQNFLDNYIDWNKDSISSHRASMEIKYFTFDNFQIFKLDTVLPPGNTELYPELVLSAGSFTGSLKTGFIYNKEDISLPLNQWIFDPYEIYVKYDFFYDSYLKQTVSLDPEASSNNLSRTELFLTAMDSDITLKQNLEVKLNNWKMKESSTDLKLWFMDFNFLAEDTFGYSFQPLPLGWTLDSSSKFQPSKASAGINYSYEPDPFWKNRIRLSTDINSSWTMNLLKYTDTALSFSTKFSLYIAEFLEFSFESKSVNRATYRYIPGYTGDVGPTGLNPIIDLIKSFNFFDKNDRKDSNFNIESISISAVHHLSDWDLNVEYSGGLDLIGTAANSTGYQWKSEFSIFVTWKPIPEIKKNISYSENEISFE